METVEGELSDPNPDANPSGGGGDESGVDPVQQPFSVVPPSEGFNVGPDLRSVQRGRDANLKARRRRMHSHFDDLAECYFTSRTSDILFPPKNKKAKATNDDDRDPDEEEVDMVDEEEKSEEIDKEGLNEFSKCLSKFTKYSSVRPLATLSYTADIFNNASIVSSIEFDKDNEYFAIAGVTKRIKVYDYNVVLKDMVDIHYPNAEMTCSSKISCVAWNSFVKASLASSDYDGTVVLWDANSCQKARVYQVNSKQSHRLMEI